MFAARGDLSHKCHEGSTKADAREYVGSVSDPLSGRATWSNPRAEHYCNVPWSSEVIMHRCQLGFGSLKPLLTVMFHPGDSPFH